jgi:hypothetical protein
MRCHIIVSLELIDVSNHADGQKQITLAQAA